MSFYSQLTRFIEQSKTTVLTYNTYIREYNDLRVKVSFGQGVAARIPWISFLKPPFSTSNGIYPVYLLYKKENLLILAYGVSETKGPAATWDVNEESINKLFDRKFGYKPYRYGDSKVFRTYDLNYPLSQIAVDRDLNEITAIYKSKLEKLGQIPSSMPERRKEMGNHMSSFHEFEGALKGSNLKFELGSVHRLLASLLSKRFLILTGLSGSGKTKLAQAFVKWISPSKEHYELIPVGADWTNREPLLGYPDALDEKRYAKPESGVLDLLMKADKDKVRPYFLILDEMNLSHVERYFADFLSAMESDEAIPLHKSEKDRSGVPGSIKVPKNLFIIGTVNIDETTYMFSPKVLDRANVIEFRVSHDEMEGFLKSGTPVDLDKLEGKGANQAKAFVTLAGEKLSSKHKEEVNTKLMSFFKELSKVGAEFGYRSANDIHQLIAKLEHLVPDMEPKEMIDIAIMQKLLPKLHGSRRKLSDVLVTLAGLCVTGDKAALTKCLESKDMTTTGLTVNYPLSFEKLWRMYRNAVENGYASYAEA